MIFMSLVVKISKKTISEIRMEILMYCVVFFG